MTEGYGKSFDEIKVEAFKQNVLHLAQQKNSRIAPFLKMESEPRGDASYVSRIHGTSWQEKVARFQKVNLKDLRWDRRMLACRPFIWSTGVDSYDKLQTIADPASEYSIEAAYALGRLKDHIAIEGALGPVYTGRRGTTVQQLPKEQKYTANTNGTAISKLSLKTLMDVREKLWEDEVIEDEGQVVPWFTTARDLRNLLDEQKIQSADYNTVKALAAGEINTYMGFKFIRVELLPRLATAVAANATDNNIQAPIGAQVNFCMVPGYVCMGMQHGVERWAGPLHEFFGELIVYMKANFGATRLEDKRVIAVYTQR